MNEVEILCIGSFLAESTAVPMPETIWEMRTYQPFELRCILVTTGYTHAQYPLFVNGIYMKDHFGSLL